jgi:hypothetical protein
VPFFRIRRLNTYLFSSHFTSSGIQFIPVCTGSGFLSPESPFRLGDSQRAPVPDFHFKCGEVRFGE